MTWQDPPGQPDWRDAYGQYGQGQNPYGQDPYGQDPYGQNPYGAYDPYGQGAYGQGAYGQSAYGQGAYGPYGPAGVPRGNGMAIAALVANIVAAFLCCAGLLWIPGVITAAIALNKSDTDPESYRKLSITSWVCFAVNILLAIGGLIALAVIGEHSDTST
ncbi:hypothetical protein GCM10023191_014860 [Actinoallomurus oryzae]|jgi:hypothetical protein|uniref:DUF4190 domain-containing protein n=1 Tax=Actinoallomurus oryzae TaxID=502180 RepID=A0ABP8PJW3_9ACTN